MMINRRQFLKAVAAGTLGAALNPGTLAPPHPCISINGVRFTGFSLAGVSRLVKTYEMYSHPPLDFESFAKRLRARRNDATRINEEPVAD